MTGDGAQVLLLAGLERDLQRGALARVEQRGLLAADLEVVRQLALVDDLERDGAVRRRGGRELELELGGGDGDRRRLRLRVSSERRSRDGAERHDARSDGRDAGGETHVKRP